MNEPFAAVVLLDLLACETIPRTCTYDAGSIVMILFQDCEASLAVIYVPICILKRVVRIDEEEHLQLM